MPKDLYAQRSKALTSTAQKVRGWVGSDPSRTPELADALVELTAHRVLGHAWAAAAGDAQEAVKLSAQLLTANGPIGPYTDLDDAARYVTAVVQFAVVQAGLGLPDAAGRSIDSLTELLEQLGAATVAARLSPRTVIWSLCCSARAALAGSDVVTANAYADAAADRLAESGLAGDVDSTYLVIDTDRLVSDARWAAGDATGSLGYLVAAERRYDEVVEGRLAEPGRLSDGLRDRLAEPLPGIYGDLADRLAVVGERALGLAVRRELVATLHGLAERSPDWRTALETASTALEADLSGGTKAGVAERIAWSPLNDVAAYASTTAGSGGRAARENELLEASQDWLAAARPDAERTEAALRQAAQSEAEREAAALASARAAEAERQAAEAAEAEHRAQREAEERAAAEEAERQERKRRRAERLAEHQRLQEQEQAARRAVDPVERARLEYERERVEAERVEAERVEAARVEAERVEAERVDAERVEAERVEAERVEAERVEAERERAERERAERERAEAARVDAERVEAARVDAERVEAARVDAERVEAARVEAARVEAARVEAARVEAERERAERERAEAARVEAARVEAERERAEQERVEAARAAENDELAVAQRTWNEAKSSGDRRAARAANERVVDVLRQRAQDDLARYGPALIAALEELSRTRLRSGDIFGSRGPAKEARSLAKTLDAR